VRVRLPLRPSWRVLWHQSHATSALWAGLVAAVPAGVHAAVVLVLADLVVGRPPATTLLALGPLAHALLCLFWGAVWGLVVAFTAHHLSAGAGALWGGVYGLGIWLVQDRLVFTWLGPPEGLLAHLVYGVTLGSLFHYARARSEHRRHRRELRT
jgi:hypothetical protein